MLNADDVVEELGLQWTADCQGKMDFDAPAVRISARFYPRGGGFALVTKNQAGAVEIEEEKAHPEIPPSAVATILFGTIVLQTKWFHGKEETEVKLEVEQWVVAQLEAVQRTIEVAFGIELKRGQDG